METPAGAADVARAPFRGGGVIPNPLEQFTSLRAKRSNPGGKFAGVALDRRGAFGASR
jgi:hypothetical protein